MGLFVAGEGRTERVSHGTVRPVAGDQPRRRKDLLAAVVASQASFHDVVTRFDRDDLDTAFDRYASTGRAGVPVN
jgi:hypothetical protein